MNVFNLNRCLRLNNIRKLCLFLKLVVRRIILIKPENGTHSTKNAHARANIVHSPTSKTFTNFPRKKFSLDVVHRNLRNHHYSNKLSYLLPCKAGKQPRATPTWMKILENHLLTSLNKYVPKRWRWPSKGPCQPGQRPRPTKIIGPFLVQAGPTGRRKICEKTFQTEPVRPSWVWKKSRRGLGKPGCQMNFSDSFSTLGKSDKTFFLFWGFSLFLLLIFYGQSNLSGCDSRIYTFSFCVCEFRFF